MDVETIMRRASGPSPDEVPHASILRRVRRRRFILQTSGTLGVLVVIAVTVGLAAERRFSVIEFGPVAPGGEGTVAAQRLERLRREIAADEGESQCEKVIDALPRRGVAREWADFPWRKYGFHDVAIPADIAGLRVGSVNCAGDGIPGKVEAAYADLYRGGGNHEEVAALLLVGVDQPEHATETWEQHLSAEFPGDWEFKRNGSVLVGRPRTDAPPS